MSIDRATILYAVEPPHTAVRLPLGDGAAEETGGIGGWEEVDRPKRGNAVDWIGSVPVKRLKIPVMFSAWPDGSVEAPLLILTSLGVRQPGATRPPVLRTAGVHSGGPWVLEDLELGEALRRPSDGLRCRQALSVNLLAYVPVDSLGSPVWAATRSLFG